MKHLFLPRIVLAALSSVVLLAQPAPNLVGSWQGVLLAPGGRELRTMVVLKNAASGLNGLFYSPDQSPQGLPLNAISMQGPVVKFSIPAMGVTYEGKWDATGPSLTGTFTQGPNALPLNLIRATPETAWAIPEAPAPPKPMDANASPVFEVATIKPSKPDAQGKALLVRGRQFSTVNTSLMDLITFAYGVQSRQVTGGPGWMDSEKYDLTAQPDGEGQPNERQWRTMLQKLLAERFHVTFHRDTKELPVYAIVPGKASPKLTPSTGNPEGLPGLFFRGLGILPAQNASMADLAGVLQNTVFDRPVVDQSKLTGRWDFTLTWTPDEFQFGGQGARAQQAAANVEAPPDIFAAFQEQLGLRLESTKAPVEVLVIDRVEKPSEN